MRVRLIEMEREKEKERGMCDTVGETVKANERGKERRGEQTIHPPRVPTNTCRM